MEQRYRFHCPQCRYAARVSGGDGEHFDEPSSTWVCLECERLFEIPCQIVPWSGPITFTSGPPACPVEADHMVQKWTHPGPCPRCSTELERHSTTKR